MATGSTPEPWQEDLIELVDEIRRDVRFFRIAFQVLVVLWFVGLMAGLVAAVNASN